MLTDEDVASLCLKFRQRAEYFMEQAHNQKRRKSSLDTLRNVVRVTACASTLKWAAQEIEAVAAYKQEKAKHEEATARGDATKVVT